MKFCGFLSATFTLRPASRFVTHVGHMTPDGDISSFRANLSPSHTRTALLHAGVGKKGWPKYWLSNLLQLVDRLPH
jgi:hypothetical protein